MPNFDWVRELVRINVKLEPNRPTDKSTDGKDTAIWKKNPLEYYALHIIAIIYNNHLFVDVYINIFYDNDEKVHDY